MRREPEQCIGGNAYHNPQRGWDCLALPVATRVTSGARAMHSHDRMLLCLFCRHMYRDSSPVICRGMHRPYNVDNGKTSMSSDQPRGHRRSIRLPGYDYTQPGAYFVTICTQDGECLFDDPVLRRVAETMWQRIPSHFGQVSLDASVVMPNHAHGILIISDTAIVGSGHSETDSGHTDQLPVVNGESSTANPAGNASPLPRLPAGAPSGSLGAIIGNYKSVTTRRINQIRKTPGFMVWQRNYYEHIIRTERAMKAIQEYILNNPARWHLDKYNAQASGPDPMAAEVWRLLGGEEQ
jgi:putative transposase